MHTLTHTLVVSRFNKIVFIIDTTLVEQYGELTNFLIPNKLFDLWAKFILKLNAFGNLSFHLIIVRVEPRQLLKLGSIVCDNHTPLVKFKEFDLLFATHIS